MKITTFLSEVMLVSIRKPHILLRFGKNLLWKKIYIFMSYTFGKKPPLFPKNLCNCMCLLHASFFSSHHSHKYQLVCLYGSYQKCNISTTYIGSWMQPYRNVKEQLIISQDLCFEVKKRKKKEKIGLMFTH